MPEFTLFIPVLNEAAILRANTLRLIESLDQLNRKYEIIIGSNGSTDQTAAQGEALASEYEQVRFFHVDRRGPGLAFARAVRIMDSPRILTMDMDLSVDLAFIPQALGLLTENQVVIGSKFQGLQERSLSRILGSGLFIACAHIFLGMPYQDYSLGAKAFQRETVNRAAHLIDSHTAYIGNIIFAARQRGASITEIPVACSDQRASRFNLTHEGLYRVGWLLRLFWRYRLRKNQI